MFANTFQSGFVSIFYSIGSNPLSLWDKQVKNGHIRRVIDDEVKSLVLEISGTNVATTYISCPIKLKASLAIRLPFLVMIVKNMKKYFTFEIQILDDKNMHRRFRVSNFQSTTKVRPFCTSMPIGLSNGWNQIQFNLADITKRAYGTLYIETVRVQIHANVRIRRIYFANRLYNEDEMPSEYKLFLPLVKEKVIKKPVETVVGPEKVVKETITEVVKQAAVEELPSGAPPTPVTEGITQDEQLVGEFEENFTGVSTEIQVGEVLATEMEIHGEYFMEGEVYDGPEIEAQPSEEEGPSEIPTEITTEGPTETLTDVSTIETPSEPQDEDVTTTETYVSPEEVPSRIDVAVSAQEIEGEEEEG